MTVTYTLEVSQARFWGFPKLLARWRGSIYRLMYREMCAFLAAYYIVAFIYRYAASTNMQRRFERFAVYCKEFTAVVPITFVLGFYVAFVVGRWWQQYISIPWPDRIAMQISVFVQGADERGRLIRRALVRYLNLLAVLTFQSTSTVIKKRFPTIEHLVDAGLLTANERADLEATVAPHGIWWIPAQWFAQLAMVARKEGRIFDDMHLKSLIDDLMEYRRQCALIWSYDWISVPLVYTQVVTIAVYSFFASCLFGRQYLLYGTKLNERHEVDYYVPVFTILQFFFYVGWLKVAESMICPFGEDDDDFDMNWLVDRNVQVGYVIVDQMHSKYPKLSRDIFWDNLESEMPYTQAAANYKREPFFGSTTAMNISVRQAEWDTRLDQVPPISEEENPSEATSTSSSRLDCSAQRERQRHWRGRNNEKGSRSELNEEGEDGEDNEDDDDDDADSNTSRQFEAKQRKKRGLMGLALGYSRQALGSKLSLISRTSKTTATKWKRSPGLTRKNSIPVPSLNRSPRSASPIDEVTIPIEVNVPPVLIEEPEHEWRSSGSLSMKTSAPKSECYMEGNTEVVPNAVEFTNVASSSVSSGNRIVRAIKSISDKPSTPKFSEDSEQKSGYDSHTELTGSDSHISNSGSNQ